MLSSGSYLLPAALHFFTSSSPARVPFARYGSVEVRPIMHEADIEV